MVYSGKVGGGRNGGGVPCEMPAVYTGQINHAQNAVDTLYRILSGPVADVNSRICDRAGMSKFEATLLYRFNGIDRLPKLEGLMYALNADTALVSMFVKTSVGAVQVCEDNKEALRRLLVNYRLKPAKRK